MDPKINCFAIILLAIFIPVSITKPVNSTKKIPLENPNLFFDDIKVRGNSSVSFRNALSTDDTLWPMGVIPIEIHDDLKHLESRLIEAFDHYHENTCIRFVKHTDEYDYIQFINDVSEDANCYSSIGRQGGRQPISLGEGCWCLGTIIHEIMHAVGFFHEQNRSDRNDYIKVFEDNIDPRQLKQFIALLPYQNRLLTDYDYESIMQYPFYAFNRNNDQTTVTMQAKKKKIILKHACEKNKLSELDIVKIRTLYQCL